MKSGYDQFFKTAKNQTAVRGREDSPVHNASTMSAKRKRKLAALSKRQFPMKSFFMFFVLLVGVAGSIQYLDQIDEFLSNLEISMSSALANTEAPADKAKGTTPAAPATVAADPKVATDKAAEEKLAIATSDDPTDYLFKLADRKKQLDKREAELVRREDEVAKLKSEIEAKLNEMINYRSSISTLLQDRVASDSAKVETLVQVYSTMKPSQAAKVFETMDEDLVIEILSKMKKKSAADILNLVKSDKAQILAEKYAGYRLPDRKVSSQNQSSIPNEGQQEQQQPTKEDSDQ